MAFNARRAAKLGAVLSGIVAGAGYLSGAAGAKAGAIAGGGALLSAGAIFFLALVVLVISVSYLIWEDEINAWLTAEFAI